VDRSGSAPMKPRENIVVFVCQLCVFRALRRSSCRHNKANFNTMRYNCISYFYSIMYLVFHRCPHKPLRLARRL
jgi:hypothetical protein